MYFLIKTNYMIYFIKNISYSEIQDKELLSFTNFKKMIKFIFIIIIFFMKIGIKFIQK